VLIGAGWCLRSDVAVPKQQYLPQVGLPVWLAAQTAGLAGVDTAFDYMDQDRIAKVIAGTVSTAYVHHLSGNARRESFYWRLTGSGSRHLACLMLHRPNPSPSGTTSSFCHWLWLWCYVVVFLVCLGPFLAVLSKAQCPTSRAVWCALHSGPCVLDADWCLRHGSHRHHPGAGGGGSTSHSDGGR